MIFGKGQVQGGKFMPEFVNPFSGKVSDRKLTLSELIRAIRLDIASEHEAVHQYLSHADSTDHPLVKKVLTKIQNEERVHIGELTKLLEILTKDESEFMKQGQKEVEETIDEIGEEVIMKEQKSKYEKYYLMNLVKDYDVIDFVTKKLKITLPKNIEKSTLFEIVMKVQESMEILFKDVESQIEYIRKELEEIYPDCSEFIPFIDVKKMLFDEKENYVKYYIYQIYGEDDSKVFLIQTVIDLMMKELQQQIEKELQKMLKS